MSARHAASGSEHARGVASLLDELVRSLQAEGTAVIDGDLDRLITVAAHKNELLTRLAPALQHAHAAERRRFAAAIRAAKAQSDDNARIFAVRMTMHRARTEALLGAAGAGLYGRTGASESDRLRANAYARTSA